MWFQCYKKITRSRRIKRSANAFQYAPAFGRGIGHNSSCNLRLGVHGRNHRVRAVSGNGGFHDFRFLAALEAQIYPHIANAAAVQRLHFQLHGFGNRAAYCFGRGRRRNPLGIGNRQFAQPLWQVMAAMIGGQYDDIIDRCIVQPRE